MRIATLAILLLLSFAAAAQGGIADPISAGTTVAAAGDSGSVSDDSRWHISAGAGVLTFHGDGIESDPRVSFELRGEYDLSDPWYVYLGYVYGQAIAEEEEYGVLPVPGLPYLAPGLRLRFLGLFPLLPVPSPTVDNPFVLLPLPVFAPTPGLRLRRPIFPVPFEYDAGDDEKDIHIITAGPGLRCEQWERLSFNWDAGAGVVFGQDVDTHLALNSSLRGSWQMTDRVSVDASLMGTLTNTEIGNADLDWGWGGHLGMSIALGK